MLSVLMDVIPWLKEAGLSARRLATGPSNSDSGADLLLEVSEGDRTWAFVVQVKHRSPYPNEVADLESQRTQLEHLGKPMLIVPFVTEGTGEKLTEAGWSWADLEGNFHLRAPGLLVHQRRPRAQKAPSKTIPQGPGSLSIIRSLIRFAEGEAVTNATAFAKQVGVSQPRASQVLSQLQDLDLVDKINRRWSPHREELLNRFLEEYRGPGGSERYFYSLSEPTDVAIAATSGSEFNRQESRYPVVVSGDVAADLMASWMRPRVLVLYASEDIPVDSLKLTPAMGRDDANVMIRFPQDDSVFPHQDSAVSIKNYNIPLADWSQVIWDLRDLGGTDRLEAAGQIHKWLLNR